MQQLLQNKTHYLNYEFSCRWTILPLLRLDGCHLQCHLCQCTSKLRNHWKGRKRNHYNLMPDRQGASWMWSSVYFWNSSWSISRILCQPVCSMSMQEQFGSNVLCHVWQLKQNTKYDLALKNLMRHFIVKIQILSLKP